MNFFALAEVLRRPRSITEIVNLASFAY